MKGLLCRVQTERGANCFRRTNITTGVWGAGTDFFARVYSFLCIIEVVPSHIITLTVEKRKAYIFFTYGAIFKFERVRDEMIFERTLKPLLHVETFS